MLYADLNAIIIGFYGRSKMVQAMQGVNPFAAPSHAPQASNGKVRHVPSPEHLPPLTPEAFDAMFPGKSTTPKGVVVRE